MMMSRLKSFVKGFFVNVISVELFATFSRHVLTQSLRLLKDSLWFMTILNRVLALRD